MGWLEEKNGHSYLHIHVQPRASRNEIAGLQGDSLRVRLTSPPVDGAANRLLMEFMAKKLGISRSRIDIVSGERSRHKTLKVEGASKEKIAATLLVKTGRK